LLLFASFYFLLFPFYFLLFPRIESFQWVTSEKITKIRAPSQIVRETSQSHFSSFSPRPPPAKRVYSEIENISSQRFCFCQANSPLLQRYLLVVDRKVAFDLSRGRANVVAALDAAIRAEHRQSRCSRSEKAHGFN